MYTSRPSAASSMSSNSTTSTMSSMTSGAPSSVDSRSAFSLHRRTSLTQSQSGLHQRSQTDHHPHSQSNIYPAAYPPAGEPDDAPFLGTPFALERPYEYPFPSPNTESCPDLSRTWNSAAAVAAAAAAKSGLPSLSYSNSSSSSSVLAQSLLSSAKFTVEGGLAYVGNEDAYLSSLKRKEQARRENLAKRRATTANILHPLNIPKQTSPPIPPALLSREQAGQLSPILGQLSPRLGMPSPRMFRNWRGDENGSRNDTTKRTTR